MVISVKEAVNFAKKAAEDFFGTSLIDLQLEEVELDDSTNCWLITLGFNTQNTNPMRGLGVALGADRQYIRKYKLFKIDAENGSIKSMKIREV